jgi:CheY-like chemotaxis protein
MHTALRVMYVDDSETDRLIFKNAINKIDPFIEFIGIETAYAAMAYLTLELGPPPDYIFLDINMHGMDGFECLTEIKKHPVLKNIPVIMFTTARIEMYNDTAILLGAARCITKPYSFEDNCGVIADVLFGAKQAEMQ